MRAVTKRLVFFVKAKVFGIQSSLMEETSNLRSLRHIFGVTLKPLILAGGFAGIIQFIDPYLHPYYQVINIRIPDDSDYVTFLATVSGIGGVFIGLYYAGISVVGSAIYAKVPNNVRDLLAQERFGNQYMRFLSFLTFLGIILIAFRISGLPRVYLAVPIVTVFAGIGVIAFVKLGQRAFYLFDPTQLSSHIFEQLQRWLRIVKVGGYQWSDESFQNYAYQRASATLDTLETLVDITAKELHLSGKPFISLSKNLLGFLLVYEQSKRSIPTNSAWFEQHYQHRDWYRTEYFQVNVAHTTGTFLQPEKTLNQYWIEDRVLPILKKCIAVNLKAKKYSELSPLFNHVDIYAKDLAQAGEVQRASEVLIHLFLDVLDQIAVQSEDKLVEEEMLEKVAVVEQLASISVSIALGHRAHIESFNRKNIEKGVNSIRWDKDVDIYQQDFPTYCLAKMEWIKTRLDFEIEVDGKQTTPQWYCSDLVCSVVAERFAINVNTLVSIGSDLYDKARVLSHKNPWLTAALMSREWEYWHRVEGQIDTWKKIWSNLETDRKFVSLEWPTLDIEKLIADCGQRKTRLLELMSKQSLKLALKSSPQGLPDYAGQFLHASGEVIFDALLSNNIGLVKSIFESYLYGCVIRFDNIRPKVVKPDWWAQREFKIATAPLLDVMAVSGYAKLLADYHGNDALWNEVCAVWDKYLDNNDEPSRASLLASAVDVTEASFDILIRSELRNAWKRKIESLLREVSRHEVIYPGAICSDTVIDHDSALVRIFAEDPFHSLHDGIDILISVCPKTII